MSGPTPPLVIRLLRAQHGLCHYCHTPLLVTQRPFPARATVEHLTPVCRGGTNDPANLRAACHACNREKGPLTDAEYKAVRHDQAATRQARIAVQAKVDLAQRLGLRQPYDLDRIPAPK